MARQEALAAIEQAAALAGPNGHLTLLEVTSFEVEGAHRGPEIVPAKATRIHRPRGADCREVGRAVHRRRWIRTLLLRRSFFTGRASGICWLWARRATGWLGGCSEEASQSPRRARSRLPCSSPARYRRASNSLDRILIASDGLPGSDALVEFAGRPGSRPRGRRGPAARDRPGVQSSTPPRRRAGEQVAARPSATQARSGSRKAAPGA